MLLNILVPLIQVVCPMALSLTRLSMVRLQAILIVRWLNKEGHHGLSVIQIDGSSFIE